MRDFDFTEIINNIPKIQKARERVEIEKESATLAWICW